MNTPKFASPFRSAAHLFFGRLSSTGNNPTGKALISTPKVQIADGKLLYLMISIYVHGETLFARTILRGEKAKKHLGLYNRIQSEMNAVGLCTKALGGGMMDVDTKEQTIHIYGKCKTFGRADHKKTKDMLKSSEKYEKFKITVS